MAKTNMNTVRIKPEVSEPLTLHVLRSERLSPHFLRVTLGDGDVARFTPMGYDQWFRLFIPVADDSLSRLPDKFNTLAYAKYLTISKTSRPILRNYSVRAFHKDAKELDVDFVLHDTSAGPAAEWAQKCKPGDKVAILDEGISFNPPPDVRHTLLVADESGLPAAAAILASLPDDFQGKALLEIPAPEDEQALTTPPGVELTWISRKDAHDTPGRAALSAALALPLPEAPFFGWVVGEQTLPTTLRRHWVKAGVPKDHIMFCGYWRHRS
ncbi:siderophore-interacting protein [Actinomadura hibisca]|uniref:siderophore-interacting protein n=1 Tax=Actinomadura hibisca TaxID=68565 RepID=UPI000B04D842|nr:siderophore-interacting protein [Actinomadura hibisca]